MTASNDQRLKTWHVRFDVSTKDVEGLSIQRGGNVYTAVADIAGVDVIEEVGNGIQGDEGQTEKRGTHERRVRVVVCGVGMDVR